MGGGIIFGGFCYLVYEKESLKKGVIDAGIYDIFGNIFRVDYFPGV